jgi:hypothetical protein
MKICPTCQQKYADSLQFCLSDGTVLSVFNDPQATLRLDARQTQPPTQVKRGLTFGLLALAGVGLVGLIFVAGVLVLYRTWSNQGSRASNRPGNSSATSTNQPNSIPLLTKDEVAQKLEQVNAEVGSSLVHGDLEALDRLLAEDYRYVSDAGLSLTKQEILTLFRTGNVHYDYLTTSDPKVDVDSDLNKGVVSGRARSKGHFRRQPFTDDYFYKNTYEKRNGAWQLVSGLAWHH